MRYAKSNVVLAGAVLSSLSRAVVPDTGSDSFWTWVGEVGGASGTAISSREVITAKHVGASTFTVLGQTYTAIERVNHPTYDIAILRFGVDLPGWYNLSASSTVGSEITLVGFGDTGILNQQGNGYDILQSNHIRRAATNTLHFKDTLPGYGPYLGSWLYQNGDGVAAAGDSGGALFLGNSLAGVISFAYSTNHNLPVYGFASQNGGVPYIATGAIDLTLPEIRTWVEANTVPEPSSLAVFAALSLGTLLRRRAVRHT